MMRSNFNCVAVEQRLEQYLNHTLSSGESNLIDEHLKDCKPCREALNASLAVGGLLEYIKLDRSKPAVAAAGSPDSRFLASLNGAPWWGVSVMLHGLVIALAGLISMAVSLPPGEDAVITVTELAPRPKIEQVELNKPKTEVESALHSKHETPPTDPTSREVNDIVVPPDILAKAELGDHFETVNPDRPDTQSAFGNPDAHMFHSVQGNDEPEGGGGMGGSSLEDLIGVGGASSPGSGGGWGGGHGSGIGVGTGSGRGSFGQRTGGGRKLMVKRHGGNAATENAVNLALRWLAYHQEPDGSWSIKKHGGTKLDDTCEVGVSALALLAFLGAGHTEKIGEYKENVKKAVAYLISQQKATGEIGDNRAASGWVTGSGYNHPIAGMALAEAFAMARIAKTGEAAQSAVYYSVETYWDKDLKIWRYAPPTTNQKLALAANVSVVGWFVMQLKSAKVAGLHFDHASIYGHVSDWLDKLKRGEKGAKGDAPYGNHRYAYAAGDARPSVANTSMALVCRLFMGMPAQELADGGEYLMTETPEWEAKNGATCAPRGACPHYYWYYGTLSMFQMGGAHWKKWNESLQKTLVPNQRKDGDFAGSWDLLGSDGPFAGRAYTTAMGALCLEVYYRYLQISDH
jgi:hypothetical protein